jgi:Novel STAND NTPase 1
VTETAVAEPAASAPAATNLPATPYRGLRPYTEAEAAFFFGREAEEEIIAANILAARLTLLYGPSGVGKSSVLLAGVVNSLRERSRENLADEDAAGFAVVVVRSWGDPNPLTTIAAAARAEASALLEREDLPDPPSGATLADVLDHWSVQVGGKLLVLFDQFEEYFLYHDRERGPGSFDVEFPQAVNRAEVRANFLVSIRDDALARLDRFKGRIPNLFENRLQVNHLTLPAARDAVKLPIEAYNRLVPPEQRFAIEEELVEDVLDQVRTGRVSFESMGVGAARESADVEARVETPILQVVLTALWEKEVEQGSHTLRAQTLAELGGAEQLVRDRLDERMNRLDSGEQEIAAEVARFLVTPSGTKIAWTPADLTALAYPDTDLAAWAQPQVESVLAKLSEGDARILRPVAPPGGHGQTQYEIFHDILGPAILDWRTRHIKDLELADAVRNVVGLVVLIGTTFWWLLLTLGVVVAGVDEDPNYFYLLIWTLSALVVFIGWWRVLRRRSGRRRTNLRFLLALVVAEIAAFTAPLSILVIVPVVLVRRWRHRRAVPAVSPGSS